MNKDLGWFLIGIGSVWIALTINIDLTLLAIPNAMAYFLMIAGIAWIMLAVSKQYYLKPLIRLILIIIFILVLRANFWQIPFSLFNPIQFGTNNFQNTYQINPQENMEIGCSACTMIINQSMNNNLTINARNSVQNEIRLDELKNIQSGELDIQMPQITSNLSVSTSFGIINITEPMITGEVMTVSNSFGSIIINDLGTADYVNADNSFGSITIIIQDVQGMKNINLDTSFGSIDIIISEGTEFLIQPSTSFGSITNNYGYLESPGSNNATNKIIINADTSFGSISIKRGV